MHKDINWLLALERFGWDFSLERIKNVISLLGNPHLSYKTVHVAGTNGKGSVCAMIAQILKEAGFKAGLYTSPHLVRLNERYCINNKSITDKKLVQLIRKVKSLNLKLTCFEFMTAVAFLYFKEENVDYAVIEVGLGGRLDATNIIKPLLTIITSLSLEHEDILGKGIGNIAREKAGIIKPNIPLFTSEDNEIIKKVAQEKSAPFFLCKPSPYPTALKGSFQVINAGIAVEAARYLGISEGLIKKALMKVKWPCRLEFIEKNILIDVSHNPAAIKSMSSFVKTLSYNRLFIIFSCLKDKDAKSMLQSLPSYYKIVISKIHYYRALEPELIKKYAQDAIIIENVKGAINEVKKELKDNDLLLICGSVYLAGEALGNHKMHLE